MTNDEWTAARRGQFTDKKGGKLADFGMRGVL
jgi:hypothetical protein